MAIGLQNKPNTDAPDSDYPYGKTRDISSLGAGDGTPANTLVHGDFHQFFEKMMADAGITANGLFDNEYNGWQLFEALLAVILARIDVYPSRFYNAIISQSSTSNPSVSVLGQNTLGTITWTRDAQGVYLGDLNAVIGDAQVFVGTSKNPDHLILAGVGPITIGINTYGTSETFVILTYDSGALSDDILDDTSLRFMRTYL